MSKHTEGPWEIDECAVITRAGALKAFHIYGSNDKPVAVLDDSAKLEEPDYEDGDMRTTEKLKADAALIAAAPELLEACLFVVNDVSAPGEDAQLTSKGYNRLCAAIAKAEGR
jgi:hypothetical protein